MCIRDRLLFIAIEAVARRKVPQQVEGLIHAGGILTLLGFLLVVTVFDVKELVGDEPQADAIEVQAPANGEPRGDGEDPTAD